MTTASPGRHELATVSELDDFERLGGEWDALVRAMPRPSPFLLHGWLTCWWRRFGDGGTLAIEVARWQGRLVAALPLYLHSRLGLSVAEFLGSPHSALADLLLDPKEPAAVGDARPGARRQLGGHLPGEDVLEGAEPPPPPEATARRARQRRRARRARPRGP